MKKFVSESVFISVFWYSYNYHLMVNSFFFVCLKTKKVIGDLTSNNDHHNSKLFYRISSFFIRYLSQEKSFRDTLFIDQSLKFSTQEC